MARIQLAREGRDNINIICVVLGEKSKQREKGKKSGQFPKLCTT
jgi:hypothetical protein